MNKLRDFLAKIFDLGGGTYVGMATALTFACVILDSWWDRWKTPDWWTTAPLGVYSVILITFAGSKILSYWTDSKYNSPPGQPPPPWRPPPMGP